MVRPGGESVLEHREEGVEGIYDESGRKLKAGQVGVLAAMFNSWFYPQGNGDH